MSAQNTFHLGTTTLVFLFLGLPMIFATVFVNETLHLSSPRTSFGSVQADDKMYFAGGYQHHDYVASSVVDVLSLSNNSWNQLNLTSPRGMITPVVIEPRIYFVGGVDYTNVPYFYQTTSGTFNTFSSTNVSYTSGPTVRRPTKLSLYNTTLIVVGHNSIDVMDTETGAWSHNEKVPPLLTTLRNTTTYFQRQTVLIYGGYNITTNEWTNSIWIIDVTSRDEPIEIKDKAPQREIISFFSDENNQAVVFEYSDLVALLHIPTQQWAYPTNGTSFVSAVSYYQQTIIAYSNGYWLMDWIANTSSWRTVQSLSFAFTIGNQFVYSVGVGSVNGLEYRVVKNNFFSMTTVTAEPEKLLNGTRFVLTLAASPTIFAAVGNNDRIYKYDATSMNFTMQSSLLSRPKEIFATNNAFFVISEFLTPGALRLTTVSFASSLETNQQIPFRPSTLVGNTFISLTTNATYIIGGTNGKTGTRFSSNSLWAQTGSRLFVMESNTIDAEPVAYSVSNQIDVYNYIENTWEDSIEISPSPSVKGYLQATAIDNNLVIFTPQNTSVYNPATSEWRYSAPAPSFNNLPHPTFASVPIIDGTIYLRNGDSGITAVTLPDKFDLKRLEEFPIVPRQIVAYERQLFLAATVNDTFPSVFYFNVDDNNFQNALLESRSQSDLTLAIYDGFLLAFGTDPTKIDFFELSTFLSSTEPLDNSFVPATVQQIRMVNAKALLVTAGGYDRQTLLYTDTVYLMTLSLVVPPQPSAQQPSPVVSPDGNTNDSTIIIAIVVPVGAAIIAGILLAVLLTQRKRRKKRQTTTNELETMYGQWFTPFSEIQFGQQIGQGASGQVFEGTWKGTKVALKVSPARANAGVISELEVMINMRPHPNVIQLFGFSVHPETDSVILIIEYCDGGSLDNILFDTHKPIPFEQQLVWIQGAARGLSHLHSNNIVHRDVAARNVLLHQNEPKLTDFGMSRFVEEDQKGTTRSELGPIRWMAPEALKNKQYSNKSDVWSFGILMYEIVARLEPHSAADPINIARQIRDQGLAPTIPSECPAELAAVMKKCWEIDSEKRPTMGQLVDIL